MQISNLATQKPKQMNKAGSSFFKDVKTTKQGMDILHFNYKREPEEAQQEFELVQEIKEKLEEHPATDAEYWDHQMIVESLRDPIKLPLKDPVLNQISLATIQSFNIANEEKRKIGWIGTGETSNAFVYQLVRYGYDVTVFDLVESNAENLVNLGAKFAKSAQEVAK